MLGTSYTRYGLFCEGLSSQNIDGECAMCESLQDDRVYSDTNLQFYFVVQWVSISCYFGILNDGFGRPHKRCWGYSLYFVIQIFILFFQNDTRYHIWTTFGWYFTSIYDCTLALVVYVNFIILRIDLNFILFVYIYLIYLVIRKAVRMTVFDLVWPHVYLSQFLPWYFDFWTICYRS